MLIPNYRILLPFSALLFQLIALSTKVSSLHLLLKRQISTPLRARGGDPNEDTTRGDDVKLMPFERVVRKVTGNSEYKFGDITRSVANATTSAVEGTVRTVTNNEDYHFGDMTKTVIGSTTNGIEGMDFDHNVIVYNLLFNFTPMNIILSPMYQL